MFRPSISRLSDQVPLLANTIPNIRLLLLSLGISLAYMLLTVAATTFRVPVRFTEVILIHYSHAVGLSRPGLALSHSGATGLPVSIRCAELTGVY